MASRCAQIAEAVIQPFSRKDKDMTIVPHIAKDKRKEKFIMVDNIIIDKYLTIIGPAAYVIYSVLIRRSRDGYSFPGLSHLQEVSGLSRNTVIKAIETLEEEGLINVVRPNRKGGRTSNEYWILEVSNNDIVESSSSLIEPVDKGLVHNLTLSGSFSDTESGLEVQKMNTNNTVFNNTYKKTRARPPMETLRSAAKGKKSG